MGDIGQMITTLRSAVTKKLFEGLRILSRNRDGRTEEPISLERVEEEPLSTAPIKGHDGQPHVSTHIAGHGDR